MHGHPLVTCDFKVRNPTAAWPAPGGENKIQDKYGDKGRDKGDQALDIHKCVDGYPFHSISSGVFEGDRNNKHLVIARSGSSGNSMLYEVPDDSQRQSDNADNP
jgi:hypothetical protein